MLGAILLLVIAMTIGEIKFTRILKQDNLELRTENKKLKEEIYYFEYEVLNKFL